MQVSDVQSLRHFSEQPAEGVTLTQLYPQGGDGNGLVAVELLEVEAGGQLPMRDHAEEQVLFVISGVGELAQGDGPPVAVRGGSVVAVGPHESYSLRNTDNMRLRVLVSASLVARTPRALGVRGQASVQAPVRVVREVAPVVQTEQVPEARSEPPAPPPIEAAAPARPGRCQPEPVQAPELEAQAAPQEPEPQPTQAEPEDSPTLPDISGLMKRGSDVTAKPRSEQRKPPPGPEQPIEPEQPAEESGAGQAEEEASDNPDLMELHVVFDGGSRGTPGEGYGSFLVQSPGRKPVIKRVEFGDNYTGNQAEYDTLIRALQYIVERLSVTGRSPDGVQLDIKSDSEVVVNQITGTFKVKDASLRKRHEQVTDLLGSFADWAITWHPQDESVRLLGH